MLSVGFPHQNFLNQGDVLFDHVVFVAAVHADVDDVARFDLIECVFECHTRVNAAGPLKDEAGQPAGGIWIVDADSADTARKLVEEDPFWPTGLRKSVNILAWTQVFADGKRLISP